MFELTLLFLFVTMFVVFEYATRQEPGREELIHEIAKYHEHDEWVELAPALVMMDNPNLKRYLKHIR